MNKMTGYTVGEVIPWLSLQKSIDNSHYFTIGEVNDSHYNAIGNL